MYPCNPKPLADPLQKAALERDGSDLPAKSEIARIAVSKLPRTGKFLVVRERGQAIKRIVVATAVLVLASLIVLAVFQLMGCGSEENGFVVSIRIEDDSLNQDKILIGTDVLFRAEVVGGKDGELEITDVDWKYDGPATIKNSPDKTALLEETIPGTYEVEAIVKVSGRGTINGKLTVTFVPVVKQ